MKLLMQVVLVLLCVFILWWFYIGPITEVVTR